MEYYQVAAKWWAEHLSYKNYQGKIRGDLENPEKVRIFTEHLAILIHLKVSEYRYGLRRLNIMSFEGASTNELIAEALNAADMKGVEVPKNVLMSITENIVKLERHEVLYSNTR